MPNKHQEKSPMFEREVFPSKAFVLIFTVGLLLLLLCIMSRENTLDAIVLEWQSTSINNRDRLARKLEKTSQILGMSFQEITSLLRKPDGQRMEYVIEESNTWNKVNNCLFITLENEPRAHHYVHLWIDEDFEAEQFNSEQWLAMPPSKRGHLAVDLYKRQNELIHGLTRNEIIQLLGEPDDEFLEYIINSDNDVFVVHFQDGVVFQAYINRD